MKQILFIFTTVTVLSLASCGGKEQNSAEAIDKELNEIVESDEYQENGLNKLRATSEVIDTKNGYTVSLALTPGESLPHVPNENFGTYCDNIGTVVARKGDADTLLVRRFVKADFADYLDEPLRSSAILDGLTLKDATASAITLEASVSVPHSDEQAVITVTIPLGGGAFTMQRQISGFDEFGDAQLPPEEGD